MASQEEFQKAKVEFEQYWQPVASMFREATSRDAIQKACQRAEAATGCKYCFGLGYLSEPREEEEDILSFHGWKVLTAESVGAALAAIRGAETKIDLLLTDVMMPSGTGPELARRLHERAPDLPVVFMSGHGAEVLDRIGLDHGSLFLQKPFGTTALLERLAWALAGDRDRG